MDLDPDGTGRRHHSVEWRGELRVRQAAGTSRAELRREGDVATCGGCGRRCPIVVEVPVLVTDAAA